MRSRVRTALIDLGAAAVRQALLQEQVATREKIQAKQSERADGSAIARAELSPSRIALAKSQMDLADARRQFAMSQASLAEAIGVPLAALQKVNVIHDPRTQPVPDGELVSAKLREVALQSRSDVLAALADYAASESALQLEVAKQYPIST